MQESSSFDELFLPVMSRRDTDLVAGLIFQKPELFEELFGVFMRNSEGEKNCSRSCMLK